MSNHVPWLIDPKDGPVDFEVVRLRLKEFAAAHIYRSAAVEELILDNDFFRRALRPDDIDEIDWSQLVDANSASSLNALATHRMLLCINESRRIQMPSGGGRDKWTAFVEFYSDRNRALAEVVRPFLEYHAFHALEQKAGAPDDGLDSFLARVLEAQTGRAATEARLAAIVASSPAASETRRFQLVQFFGLAQVRRRAMEGIVESWLAEFPVSVAAGRSILQRIPTDTGDAAKLIGSPIEFHSCWQFYLPTSIAVVNLLYYLADRGCNALRSLGALLYWSIAQEAFLRQNPGIAGAGPGPALTPERMRNHMNELIAPVAARLGDFVWSEASAGFSLCAAAQEIADNDLAQQLTWLSDIGRYQRAATAIQDKIDNEHISIDRDTFVEPREMCSTTHVHDDYRLVVIESGEMVFWATPGMRLCLAPGEKMLVPRHRLHGSSILTESCVYHQPIIPEDWVIHYTQKAEPTSA